MCWPLSRTMSLDLPERRTLLLQHCFTLALTVRSRCNLHSHHHNKRVGNASSLRLMNCHGKRNECTNCTPRGSQNPLNVQRCTIRVRQILQMFVKPTVPLSFSSGYANWMYPDVVHISPAQTPRMPPVQQALKQVQAQLHQAPNITLVPFHPYKHDYARTLISANYFEDGGADLQSTMQD